MNGKVTILNYSANADEIISAAGRISTTKGSSDEIYYNSCVDKEKNVKLIYKILASGHESVLEHVFLNLSFDNVSVFVEQFMIEFRLASFTVKSRRYVDFGNVGYVVPDFLGVENEAEIVYRKHMDYLFQEYNSFLELGIPKEDARFVLPYSFKSNFYCTVNAREFVKIMNELVYGRGKDYPELVELGNSLYKQCETVLPYLCIKKEQHDIKETVMELVKNNARTVSAQIDTERLVTLVSGTENPERIICQAAALNCGLRDWNDIVIDDLEKQKKLIAVLLKGGRKRELEQANFTFLFNRISLAGVTHLVRHRMQEIIIPNYIEVCDYNKYLMPNSIVEAGLEKRYRECFLKTQGVVNELRNKGFNKNNEVYLMLSGLLIPVMTTMNTNELCTFMRLRTCNRAQWEIKECADELLRCLRKKYPILFSQYGPSCYMNGKCPEGKMTCGQVKEVCDKYGRIDEN